MSDNKENKCADCDSNPCECNKWYDFECPLNYEYNDEPFGDDDHYALHLNKSEDNEIGINLVIPIDVTGEEYPRMTIEQFKQLEWAVNRMKMELKLRKLW